MRTTKKKNRFRLTSYFTVTSEYCGFGLRFKNLDYIFRLRCGYFIFAILLEDLEMVIIDSTNTIESMIVKHNNIVIKYNELYELYKKNIVEQQLNLEEFDTDVMQ